MQYLGKVIGVAVALLMGGGFWGVVLGFLRDKGWLDRKSVV